MASPPPPPPPAQAEPEPPARRAPNDTIGGIVHPLTVRQHLSFVVPALTICIGGPVAIGVVAYVLALVMPLPPLTQALNVVGCLSLGFLLKLGAMLCVPAAIISVMHHQYVGKYRLYCQVAAFSLAYWIMSTRIDELAAAGNQCQSRALGSGRRSQP